MRKYEKEFTKNKKCKKKRKRCAIPCGDRTHDLWIRSPTRYPLRQRDSVCLDDIKSNIAVLIYYDKKNNFHVLFFNMLLLEKLTKIVKFILIGKECIFLCDQKT